MEWFTLILTGLLTAIAPTGLILDQVVASNLRQQVKQVEVLNVRIDNVPSYQVLQGKIDKVRIATRGLEILENVRLDTLEVETDPISVNLETWNKTQKIRQALRHPLQGGIRLVLRENDLNQALSSDNIKSQLQKIIDDFLPEGSPSFKLVKTEIEFLANQRIRLHLQLEQFNEDTQVFEPLTLQFESGLRIIEGRSLEFLDPQGSINGQNLSSRFLNRLLAGLSEDFSLTSWERQGLVLRVLQFHLDEAQVTLALFARLEPQSPIP